MKLRIIACTYYSVALADPDSAEQTEGDRDLDLDLERCDLFVILGSSIAGRR
jgi:hypothetical protein